MRLYYFDDSGERRANESAPYFVMGGFGINADKVPELTQRVQLAATRHGFTFGHPAELKFHHVGRMKDDKPSKPQWMLRAGLGGMPQRRALVYAVLREALSTDSVRIISVAVDQRKTYGSKKPIHHAVEPLFERINFDCQEFGTSGMVLMDEERVDDKDLRAILRNGSFYVGFDRLIDTVSFMPSEESPGIQVADLVAGSISRFLNQRDPGYARVIWSFLRHRNGRRDGYGIKIYPRGACEPPSHRTPPWTETDKVIHSLEMIARDTPLKWSEENFPSHVFSTDWDEVRKKEAGAP